MGAPDFSTLMSPQAPVAPQAPQAPVSATPSAVQGQDEKAAQDSTQARVQKWKLALAGATVAPNGRQRIAALLRGSDAAGAQRLGQYHADMDAAANTNAQRQERQLQAGADLERTAADTGRIEATTTAESARGRAHTAQTEMTRAQTEEQRQKNAALPTAIDQESRQAEANISLTKARTDAATAEAEYRRAMAKGSDSPTTKLGYVTSVLQGQLGLSTVEAMSIANSMLNAPDPSKLKADLVAEYTSNMLLVDEAGQPLSVAEKEQLALEAASKIIDVDSRLYAMDKHLDVVTALKGSNSLSLFMNLPPEEQDVKAALIRQRIAEQSGS